MHEKPRGKQAHVRMLDSLDVWMHFKRLLGMRLGLNVRKRLKR